MRLDYPEVMEICGEQFWTVHGVLSVIMCCLTLPTEFLKQDDDLKGTKQHTERHASGRIRRLHNIRSRYKYAGTTFGYVSESSSKFVCIAKQWNVTCNCVVTIT